MGRDGAVWGTILKDSMDDPRPVPTYFGEYAHNLDARNRVTIPSSWRVKGDQEDFYLAWPNPEGCISIYPPAKCDELLTELRTKIKRSDRRGQQMMRRLLSKGTKFGCDGQGRILLPEPLLRHAEIAKAVTLVGMGETFEIWAAEVYAKIDEEEFDLFETMKELDI